MAVLPVPAHDSPNLASAAVGTGVGIAALALGCTPVNSLLWGIGGAVGARVALYVDSDATSASYNAAGITIASSTHKNNTSSVTLHGTFESEFAKALTASAAENAAKVAAAV